MTEQATVSAFLEAEHRWIDGRFERFRRSVLGGRIEAGPFQEAAAVLHRHIYLEEEILFPEVEARGLVGPTAVMAQEHGEICRFLGGIQDLIHNDDSSRVGAAFTALLGLLEERNFKEERVLYPAMDQLLDPRDRARLQGQLGTHRLASSSGAVRGSPDPAMIRVVLPPHLRTLARVRGEVTFDVQGTITLRSVLDALEVRYPMLRGTIRDHVTQERRALLRFFACQQDLSHEPPDARLPDAVATGAEPLLIVGAIAGG